MIGIDLTRESAAGALALLALLPAGVHAQRSPEPAVEVQSIRLPEPWGPHTPGVRTLLIVDSTRLDTISAAEGDYRPVLVRFWYPAAPTGAVPRPYMAAPTADAWRGTLPVVEGFQDGVTTNAVMDAAISAAQERWPVLLFSPGRSFPVENYQLALEYLASQGWLVAAISPPYEEALTLLPDGRELAFAGPRWESEDERGDVLMTVIDELVKDASVVLDRLVLLDRTADDPFDGRLDLSRGVGYLGHSLGGAAAAWTLERDPRVVAALSWEGQVYRDQDRPLRMTGGPLLYVIGGANRAELAGTQYRPGNGRSTVYELVIDGAWHASFGDFLHLYREYADRDWLTRHRRYVPPVRVNQITSDYAHEFFAHYLLGQEPDLLWPDSAEQLGNPGISNYPEVELRIYAR